ncbi:MAG TPA: MATE family efflux transporter [Lachnospiraceae bacterium]|nr:MATE family efflux transporter [Lachnospiraceae bacterium]
MFDCVKSRHVKELNKFAFPLIIQNITGMLIGLVDEMFIGRISAEAYGAIGIMVALMNLLAGIFGNVAVTFNIEGAKKRGENDTEGFDLYFISSIFIDIIIGIIYILAITFFSNQILGNLYGLSGDALHFAKTYAFITCPYMLLQLLIFTFNSYFKIEKKTKRLMWISIASTLINVFLDYLLVFGKFGLPRLETAGAALATIISVLLNAVALGIIIKKERKVHGNFLKNCFSPSIYLVKESMPLIGEELLEGSIFVIIINAIISNIGILEISSYLLIKYFMDIIMIAMYMYGTAELTLVSEKIGQNKYCDIKGLTIVGILISIVIYVVLSMIIIIFRDKVPMLISNETALIEGAAKLIFPMVLMNLFNPIQTILKYVLLACGKAKSVLYITALINAVVLLYITMTYFIGSKLYFVFIGLFINYFALSLIYAVYLRKFYFRTKI